MSEVDRRYTLVVADAVTADLRRVKEESLHARDQIIIFLQELRGDQILCENLINEHYADATIDSIEPFWFMQRQRLNVYRIKLCMVGNWRILTAGDHHQRKIAILAIMHRQQNYEADAELIERLRDSYARLNFTELGR
jgi:hypothetical protein